MHNTKARIDAIIAKLRQNNHKLTPQRLAIVKVLVESEAHPSVEAIYETLQPQFPTMSLATVYRTVMLIKSLSEVLELGFADGSNRYDGNKPYPHPHLVCVQCKRIIDPKLSGFEDLTREVASASGFEILTHRLDFFGVCPQCQTAA